MLGDVGPWSDRIYLAGGLAPRYLVGQIPPDGRAHVGTTDVDLIIGLSLAGETAETYRTLQNNLEKASFRQQEPSYRWARDVDGVTVMVEFLCETDQVEDGRIFRPRGEFTGPRLGAFNVRGAQLARHDYIECDIEGERLDEGGQSRVTLRVANVLPYLVLKVSAQGTEGNTGADHLSSVSHLTFAACTARSARQVDVPVRPAGRSSGQQVGDTDLVHRRGGIIAKRIGSAAMLRRAILRHFYHHLPPVAQFN